MEMPRHISVDWLQTTVGLEWRQWKRIECKKKKYEKEFNSCKRHVRPLKTANWKAIMKLDLCELNMWKGVVREFFFSVNGYVLRGSRGVVVGRGEAITAIPPLMTMFLLAGILPIWLWSRFRFHPPPPNIPPFPIPHPPSPFFLPPFWFWHIKAPIYLWCTKYLYTVFIVE